MTMNNEKSYKIGPRREFLALAAPLLILILLYVFRVYRITVSQTKGALIIIVTALLLFLWRGGHSLIVDQNGIHEKLFGVCFRLIPWEQVSAVICYPDFNMEKIGQEIRILIMLKGMKRMIIPSGDPERFHLKHPLKTLYIGHDNYSMVFAIFTPLTYCDEWGQW